jgi:Resolvase, N terminal domain
MTNRKARNRAGTGTPASGTGGKESCAVYARSAVSSAASIERQTLRCAKFIRSRGGHVAKVYVDDGSSGFKVGKGLQALLEDARQGRVQVLVVEDADRLGRSFGLLVSTLEVMRDCAVAVRFADGAGPEFAGVKLRTPPAHRNGRPRKARTPSKKSGPK